MKKNIAYIILLISLLINSSVLLAQETRVTGTLKVHPWINLPVVISTDIKGGLQSLGTPKDFTGKTISEVLNAAYPDFNREIGMVSTVVDATTNKIRYFEYSAKDNWREIFVIYGWEAGRSYAVGEYVEYDGNFYVANIVHTSSGTFIPDLLKWNNAGGKDGKYTVTEMQMDGKTLNKVAISTTVVVPGTEDNTLVTAGYSSNTPFNGNRPVTRPNWTGVSDVNFKTTTIVDFLNKVFFPSPKAYITSFRYNNVVTPGQFSYQDLDALLNINDHWGNVTVTYINWSPLTNFVFKYDITKQSGGSAITKVELLNGSNVLGTNPGDIVTGSFTVPKSSSYTKLTLRVTDNNLNVTNLDLNTSFVLPLGVVVSNVRLSMAVNGTEFNPNLGGTGSASDPILILRTGSDLVYNLTWDRVLNNDALVTDINFTGPPSMSNLVSGDYTANTNLSSVTLPNSDAVTVYHLGVSARGNVANVFCPVSYSKYYQLRDKFYCGFLLSNLQPTETNILNLQESSLKTTQYYAINSVPVASTEGRDLSNSIGSAFLTVAVPTYVSASSPQPADLNLNFFYYGNSQWNLAFYDPTIPFMDNEALHYFVKTTGPNASWYWVCIFNVSQSGNLRFALK